MIEVPVVDDHRVRHYDADTEVLHVCLELPALGRPVRLVTGDAAMTVRAGAMGIDVAAMPDRYLRRKDLG